MTEEMEAYWRERARYFEDEHKALMERLAEKAAMISSLKARLKELEEMQVAQ